jgi:hypothetical protein
MTPRLAIACLVAACGGAAPPPPVAHKAPEATPAPAPQKPGTPFGRFTAVPPDGYTLDAREDNIVFKRGEGVMIALIDGADQNPGAPVKCLGQLHAFATGMVTGMAGNALAIDLVTGNPIPRGCRLTGATADGSALVEAVSLDLGNGGVALAILLHKQPDDGASKAFDAVVASVKKR